MQRRNPIGPAPITSRPITTRPISTRIGLRHVLVVGVAFGALLAGDEALAERLYGNYRGPEDAQAADNTATEETGGDTNEQPETGPSAGESGDAGGGIGSSEGGGGGGEEGGGEEGGGEEGGGGSEGDGGSDLGSSGDSGSGASAGGGESGATTGGLGGGAGGGGFGRSASSANERFELVSWYFEHNREELVFNVAQERNRRVSLPSRSAVKVFGIMPEDTRVRSPITPEDRERIFDILKSATIDKQSMVRDTAVIALGKLGTPKAVEVLLERLSLETNLAVKQDTMLALGLTRSPAVIDPLIKALGERRVGVFAALGLGLTGDLEKAGPALHERFKKLRKQRKADIDKACVAIALGGLGYEPAVGDLAAMLKAKSTPSVVRVYCAHALGRIGGENAQKALVKALGGKDSQTRRQAALALGDFPDPSVLKELAGKNGVKNNADQLVAGFASISVGRLLAEMPESEWKKYPAVLREVALAPQKSKIKAQYANVALALFKGIDQEVRQFYTEELGERSGDAETLSAICMSAGLGGETAAGPMLSEIASASASDPKLGSYAALGIGLLSGSPEDQAKELRAIYKDVDRPDVQRGAVFALGMVGDRKDIAFLINVISKPDDNWLARYTRGAAVVSIGLIRDGESVAKLQALLSSANKETRALAIAALGYLGDKDAVPALPQLVARNNFREEFDVVKVVLGHL